MIYGSRYSAPVGSPGTGGQAAQQVVPAAASFSPESLLATIPKHQTWEEASRTTEKLYLADPMKARAVFKQRRSGGSLCIKVTDDLACLVYRTDQAQDVKEVEKFCSQLMLLMVAKESHSVAVETN